MPYPDAKYPSPAATDSHVRLLLEALEPFAFLTDNPLDISASDGEYMIPTDYLVTARMAFCRVATAIGLPGYGGDACN
jgi:hypothetical protein